MRIFISAGEASGDLHGANLARALRRLRPDVELVGFGGDRMAEAGCRLLYPLANQAYCGIGAILAGLPEIYRILALAKQSFRERRPDAVVLIDYPGFHWWLAGCAKKCGAAVSYFVPPQIWAWLTGRARKMRRLCDQVLCSLPFEEPWLRQRNIPAQYVGHPFFDEMREVRLDSDFLAREQAKQGTLIGLLPGSRSAELERNLPTLCRTAALIHAKRPDVRFVFACLKEHQAEQARRAALGLQVPVEAVHGKTQEIMHLSHSCVSVSGSVSLELLFRTKPTAILYRVPTYWMMLKPLVLHAEYITLVNLLAGELLYPEYVSNKCMAGLLSGHILHWLHDRQAHEGLIGRLKELRDVVARPGACERAAVAILELAEQRMRRAA